MHRNAHPSFRPVARPSGRLMALAVTVTVTAGLGLAGCAPVQGPGTPPATKADPVSRGDFQPQYLNVETRLMDTNLVNFNVRMRGARHPGDVEDYARCAAGQYTLIRGYEYAQHVRTNLAKDGGIWTADAVYTISPRFPSGTVALRASEVVNECRDKGIPTV